MKCQSYLFCAQQLDGFENKKQQQTFKKMKKKLDRQQIKESNQDNSTPAKQQQKYISILSLQLTPASSRWSQSFSPQPLKGQSAKLLSDPVHSISSIHTGPRPVPICVNAVPPLWE